MDTTHDQRLLKAAKAIRSTLFTLVTQVDDLCELIEKGPATGDKCAPSPSAAADRRLRVDPSTFTVHWREKRCALGFTTAFRIMERLARRPNEYLSTDRLLEDLWSGPRAYSTVRSTVFRLKAKLRSAGLVELADSIDGSTAGHYALKIAER